MPVHSSRGPQPACRGRRPADVRRAAVGLALFGATTLAMSAPATESDPADPGAAVPPVTATSPLSSYRRFAPPEPRSWREVNDNVARIGGWRVYLREAHAAEAPAAAEVTKAPAPGRPAETGQSADPATTAPAAPRTTIPRQGQHHGHH